MTGILRAAAAAGFAAALGLLLLAAAEAYGKALERRVSYSYLHDALVEVPPPSAMVTWLAPARPLVRDFTPVDEARLGQALTEAWQAHAAAMSSGRTDMLADYFSGVALERATASARRAAAEATQMVILHQSVSPAFYHLDGSVFQAEAEALTVRFATRETGLAEFEISRDATVTTLMNETTGWRVFSHERRGAETVAPPPAGADLPRLAGLNYYPAQTPWRMFWSGFDAETVERDFHLIRALGANAVRIFLPRADFLDADAAPRRLADLEHLLQLAGKAGLRVIPTLFDLKDSYSPGSWAADQRYLKTVLPVLRASGAIAFVDLKNEPDLDMATQGAGLVQAWLRTMIALARLEAPDLPLTVGWSSAEAAGRMLAPVDLVTYHDYAPLDEAAARLRALRRQARGKPVMITEIGASSWSFAAGFPGSVAAQARALDARLAALMQADGIFVWTLHDFPEPDIRAIGRSLWTRRLQSEFGMFDAAGAAKPAAGRVRSRFARFLSEGGDDG